MLKILSNEYHWNNWKFDLKYILIQIKFEWGNSQKNCIKNKVFRYIFKTLSKSLNLDIFHLSILDYSILD